MGALEEKVARLSLEQQREVDDFVEYLLRKSVAPCTATAPGSSIITELQHSEMQDPGPKTMKQNGPLILAEETHIQRGHEILPDYANYDENLKTMKGEESSRAPKKRSKEPGKLLDWID
jgi:hypothetical protein